MSDYESYDTKIKLLQTNLDNLISQAIPNAQESVKKLQEREETILAEVEKQLARVRSEKYKKEQEEYDLRMQVNKLKDEILKLQAELANSQAAQKEADKYKKMLEELREKFESTPWFQKWSDYQRDDVLFSVDAYRKARNGVINANVMGSGKTMEFAAFHDIFREEFQNKFNRPPRVLMMTKKSLVHSLAEECRKWTPGILYAAVASKKGASPNLQLRTTMIQQGAMLGAAVVINYDMLNSTPLIKEIEWDMIVIDEVHQLKGGANKNPTARFTETRELLGIHKTGWNRWERTKRRTLPDGTDTFQYPFVYMISATPVQNRVEEIWCYLHLFNPDLFPDVNKFVQQFTDWFGKFDYAEIEKLLTGQLIRQDPEIIYAQRPSKMEQTIYVERTSAQDVYYQMAREMILSGFKDNPEQKMSITAVIAQLTRLRQINLWPASVMDDAGNPLNCYESGKIDATMEMLEELLSDGQQVVIWSAQFNGVLQELERRISQMNGALGNPKAALMTGQNSNEHRSIEKKFQQGEVQVLLCNMKAAGEGFNFHKDKSQWPGGASHTIVLDRWYNPQTNNQAVDRIWRNFADEKVTVHYLHDEDSIDNFLLAMNEAKEEMFRNTIEQESYAPSKAEWAAMLKDLI